MTSTARSQQPLILHVREAMSRSVHHARVNDSVSQVARYLSDLQVTHLVVVDPQNRVVAVVTQQEVLQFYLAQMKHGEDSLTVAMEEASRWPIRRLLRNVEPITIRHDAPLADAIELFSAQQLECVPVVDRYDELKGLLTLSDILRQFTFNETAGLETGFEFYEPMSGPSRTRPAFIRRANKELVVPLDRIAPEHEFADRVMLGFDEASGRILLKFIPAGMKSSNTIAARRQGEDLVINAESFVTHYRLLDRSTTFDVQLPEDTRYLVLSPR